MHYFTHGASIAAVEDSVQAEKYAEAGWERVSCAQFMDAWQARDVRALAELEPAEKQTQPPMSPGTVLERLPGGRARYQG